MRTCKRLLSALTAGLLTLSATSAGIPFVTAADKSAIEIVNDMGLGWNLGNTFDCWNTRGYTTDTETGWGNPTTTQAMIDGIKATGFNAVRIPVTWYENADASTYDIDDAYLARIGEVIDYCYANDMYVIINMHWDWVSDGSLWLNKGMDALPQFTAMWKEISSYYKDYDEHLVFESMNEVTFDYNTLNSFNQTFVDTVRSTGGNNDDRLLLLSGANADLDKTCNEQYIVPDDDMLAVDIHYYSPPQWAVAPIDSTWGYSSTWGTDEEKQAVKNAFNRVKTTFVDKGIPVIFGEYGVLTNEKDQKNREDIVEYLKTISSMALGTDGVTAYLWDAGNAGDMQFYDRKNLKWFDPNIEQAYKEVLNSGGTDISDGYVKSDKAVYSGSNLTPKTDEQGNVQQNAYTIDISGYAGVAEIESVIIEGSVSADGVTSYNAGGAIAFSSTSNDPAVNIYYTVERWALNSGETSCTTALDGLFTDDDGNDHPYELVYDKLFIEPWYTWTEKDTDDSKIPVDLKINQIILVFSEEVNVPEAYAPEGTVKPTEPTQPTQPSQPTDPVWDVLGDVDKDGNVSLTDAVMLYQYLHNKGTLTNAAMADLNQDNKINVYDLALLKKELLS